MATNTTISNPTSYYDYDYVDDDTEAVDCIHEFEPWANVSISAVYALIFIIGFFGNLFVIIVTSFKQTTRRPVDTFVINLAVADLVFVLTLPFWIVSTGNNHDWIFGSEVCKISSYIIGVNRYSSIFFLTSMSVDRYLSIVKLLDFRHLRTQRHAIKICALIWIGSLVLAIPSAYFRKLILTNKSYCVDDKSSQFFRGFSLASICITFGLPVIIIVFCYCSILVRLRDHYDQAKKTFQRRENSLKIVVAIVLTFVLSWLPFNVLKAVDLYLQSEGIIPNCALSQAISQGLVIASCLAFVNSCMNPIIYISLDRHFRRRAACLANYFFRGTRSRASSISSTSAGSIATLKALRNPSPHLRVSKPN
uniref:G protein-coupled receptor 25 n=1 Tax=Callorhinchus milii TaxID=7868 RepID=A0A4W3GH80_CALMI